MNLLALIVSVLSLAAPSSFTVAGGEFNVSAGKAVVLGWRGTEPGSVMRVYRDGQFVYQKSNPQTVPFNVYLYRQPTGAHGYRVCTGVLAGNSGFQAQACSQTLVLNVT